ncbi:MAG: hydrogenase maturation nickel metallochaperone HypA [Eubacteriales bacterium]|nr:hydrogenase maturation nickel metallochaperone HypA [Eubacteriales bacterium]
MHELGTIIYIIDTIEKLAVEEKLTAVGSITLEVGEVSGIIPDYLKDYWLYARKKSELLKETELKILDISAVTFCQNCEKTYSTVKYAKECPYCHSTDTFLITGNEFTIKEIEAM